MFKCVVLLLFISQVCADEELMASLLNHPLLTKVFGLIDQLMVQVRTMQSLITRASKLTEQIPADLRSVFGVCFTDAWNASTIEYSARLNEAETIRLPKIRDQLKQVTSLTEQLTVMNMTDRVITDITLNMIKPSLSFVTEMLDCFKNKTQLPLF